MITWSVHFQIRWLIYYFTKYTPSEMSKAYVLNLIATAGDVTWTEI